MTLVITIDESFYQVLMFMGPAVLRGVIENAELYPIKGLFNFRDYFGEIDSYYHQTLGNELGISTGWKALDDLYNVSLHTLYISTNLFLIFFSNYRNEKCMDVCVDF